MKKYEKTIKFIIMILPILVAILTVMCFDVSSISSTNSISSVYGSLLSQIDNYLRPISIFDDLRSFILNDFFDYGPDILSNIVFNYITYLLFVEFMFLFKNVMCYIFSIANKWLERGFE